MRCTRSRWLVLAVLGCFAAGPQVALSQSAPRTVHVFVALADNVNQGIVPVPAKLGNGADPEHNLYWGAAGGVKTFFARSREWQLVFDQPRPKPGVLERCVFKHRTANVYLVADAYQGDRIRQTIADFLGAAAGTGRENVTFRAGANDTVVAAGGNANLIAYIGHDGFMDFQLTDLPRHIDSRRREAIILACASKAYFAEPLRSTGAHPLLWTTGLMAPEAYTLKDALDGWILRESDEQIRERAAMAYDRYQKCGLKGARRLLVSGL
jgi:hypothetical protein